jgi:hypothetical protein
MSPRGMANCKEFLLFATALVNVMHGWMREMPLSGSNSPFFRLLAFDAPPVALYHSILFIKLEAA